MATVSLTLTGAQHAELKAHLFPGDGCEAVAIALCGRREGEDRKRLVVRHLVLVPHADCALRTPDQVTWPAQVTLEPLMEEARRRDWSIVKIHGHLAFERFSQTDDASDSLLFPSIHAWLDTAGPHASAIMMADGHMFGRTVDDEGGFAPLDWINVVGDDLPFWRPKKEESAIPDHARRIAQTFGAGTYALLRQLRIGVVGCSGTGSPVIEQLARNCVGELVLVDPDTVELKNLNRILNTTAEDARIGARKVEVLARAISTMQLGTRVETHAASLFDPAVVKAIAGCDVVFGCMDSVDGRHLLNKLATFYAIPYFDLGVKLEADGAGGIDQVCGTVNYLQPGGSSLLSRRVYSLAQVTSAGLQRTDPATYRAQLEQGYIRGVAEDRPAVIQLNMLIASLAVNELLARLHPYRLESNGDYAIHRISLSHGIYEHTADGEPCAVLARHVGRGDVSPLLDWAELSKGQRAA